MRFYAPMEFMPGVTAFRDIEGGKVVRTGTVPTEKVPKQNKPYTNTS